MDIKDYKKVRQCSSRKEMIQLLFDGNILYDTNSTSFVRFTQKFEQYHGNMVNWEECDTSWLNTINPQDLYIVEKVEWYENIPKSGVLCWVWDNDNCGKKFVDIILRYVPDESFPFDGLTETWTYAVSFTGSDCEEFVLDYQQ